MLKERHFYVSLFYFNDNNLSQIVVVFVLLTQIFLINHLITKVEEEE